jgi:signal transduction histidine kinase
MHTIVDPPATPHDRENRFGARGWEDLVLHDLRTPLAVVNGQAQLIKRQLRKDRLAHADQAAELARRIDHIMRSASRMAGMLDELQRLTGGTAPPPRHEWVDLGELAQGVIADVCTSRPRVHVVLHGPAEPLIGWWDAGRLERALLNLVGNAAKYSSDNHAEVEVGLRRDRASSNWIVITVRDNGVGIPAADLPHIFEPFYRASNVARRFEGAGLGLASVRHTVEQHGGSISVASREGRGTTFTVRLPLVSAT